MRDAGEQPARLIIFQQVRGALDGLRLLQTMDFQSLRVRAVVSPRRALMIFKNLIGYTDGVIPPAPEEPILPRRQLMLSATERQELVQLRDHARQP
mgnify:CR=1 FL=1